jgi:hypothetical protein
MDMSIAPQVAVRILTDAVKKRAARDAIRVHEGEQDAEEAARDLESWGDGLIDAAAIIFDTPRIGDTIRQVLDQELASIYPLWQPNKSR